MKNLLNRPRFWKKKGFQFPPQPSGIVQSLYNAATKCGWLEFCNHPRDTVMPLVKEFYVNLVSPGQHNIWVRNSLVPLDSRVINAFYNLPSKINYEYAKLLDKLTPQRWNKIFITLTVKGASWANEEWRVINRIDLTPIAKVWVKFLKSRLMPTTHTTTISQERLVLLYVIVRGLPIDVGNIIEKEIRDCTMKNHKAAALLLPSLITIICVVSGVRLVQKMSMSKMMVPSLHAPSKELLVKLLEPHLNQLL